MHRVLTLRMGYFVKAKDPAGCRATADRWEGLNRTDATSLYDAACFRAQTAAVAREPADADRAMDWLRKAVDAGFNDATKMKADRDLDAVRDREDFRALGGRLEAG